MFLGDQDDIIAPIAIEHGLDAMLTGDGRAFEFHYNFLDYKFRDGDLVLTARHYMDVPGEVCLTTCPALSFEAPFVHRVLVYLALRYAMITYPSDQGYIPLPSEVADRVAQDVRAALRRQ